MHAQTWKDQKKKSVAWFNYKFFHLNKLIDFPLISSWLSGILFILVFALSLLILHKHKTANGRDCIDELIVLDDLRTKRKENKEGGGGTYGFMIIFIHSRA